MTEEGVSRRESLLDWSWEALQGLLTSWGEPSFRTQQVWRWVYRSLARDFESMGNLPLPLRARLAERFCLSPLSPLAETASSDGETTKLLFQLPDLQTVETVLMRYERRRTVCVSTQVGCAMDCPFCATGQSGFARNLTAGEIAAQVLYAARVFRDESATLTHVVVMGMGEPLVNYEATLTAIHRLRDQRGLNLGARRFTVSTVGVVPGIQRLSAEGVPVGLAVSLHAPNDALRDELVPVNRRYPLDQLLPACHEYIVRTGRRLTFEYALMEGVNDQIEHAQELADLVRGLRCHVNLIPLNPTPGSPYQASSPARGLTFHEALKQLGVSTTVRLRRGIDIQAGCGQLRSRLKSET
jgi:23S rRNA (adenine2503-C2)-methyltransferase